MTLLEQIILCILQNYVNPLFEPIIVDSQVLKIFSRFADTKQPTIKQFKAVKKALEQIPDDIFSTNIMKTNIVRFLDTVIKIQEDNEATIEKLQSDNMYLNDQNAKLKARPTATTRHLMLDANSSQLLKNAMTIPMTFR